MKLPQYITIEQRKEIARLIYQDRQQYGIEDAQLLKRLSLVAAYGVANKIKISFNQYIESVRYHVMGIKKPIKQFWGFKSECRVKSDTVFDIPYYNILYAPQKQLENEILYVYHHSPKKEGYEIL